MMASGVMLLLAGQARLSGSSSRISASPSRSPDCSSCLSASRASYLAGGFLDNRVLPLGEFGAFFSAGTIPVLSVLLGIKVGCELSVIVDRFRA